MNRSIHVEWTDMPPSRDEEAATMLAASAAAEADDLDALCASEPIFGERPGHQVQIDTEARVRAYSSAVPSYGEILAYLVVDTSVEAAS